MSSFVWFVTMKRKSLEHCTSVGAVSLFVWFVNEVMALQCALVAKAFVLLLYCYCDHCVSLLSFIMMDVYLKISMGRVCVANQLKMKCCVLSMWFSLPCYLKLLFYPSYEVREYEWPPPLTTSTFTTHNIIELCGGIKLMSKPFLWLVWSTTCARLFWQFTCSFSYNSFGIANDRWW